jgi:phospholipase C
MFKNAGVRGVALSLSAIPGCSDSRWKTIKLVAQSLLVLFSFGTTVAHAQVRYPNPFKHVVVVVQENRTPDNLFHGLLTWPSINPKNYKIAKVGVNSAGQVIPLAPVPLGITYDLDHSHTAFLAMYDGGKMDGADKIVCTVGKCPANAQFKYVDNSQHILDPYLTLAAEYGWANYMFQTNQGPSFPAHQFLFGGTSAPSATDDAMGIFIADNPGQPAGATYQAKNDVGCLAPLDEFHWLIGVSGDGSETTMTNNPMGMLCFSHDTMASLLDAAGFTWKYYAPATSNPGGSNPGGSIWNAPNSTREICQPDSNYTQCTGPEWAANVDLNPSDVLNDIGDCQLANVSWVIPTGQNSDHAGKTTTTGGPSWVASIVNAIGNDKTCELGAGYWSDTAVLITWDDWGGWYDHVAPPILPGLQGDYQYGFRVPLVVVSAYTPRACVNNSRHDFGSILKFIERVFKIKEGSLGFADERANGDLYGFFDFTKPPRQFETIAAPLDASFFINDKRPPEPPDND